VSGLLLDTHVLLWLLTDDARLGDGARRAIAKGPAHVSAASTWELKIKQSTGKVTLPDDFEAALPGAGIVELPINFAHTLRIDEVELPHRDPFDRLIVSAARLEGLDLVTADRVLLATGLPGLVDARE